MEYRNLGRSGLRVSTVGLGCNNFGMRCDETESTAVVHAALDQGINFFDTADVYGGQQSEVILGKALEGVDRSSVIIGTKFAMPMGERQQGASRGYIQTAVEASLKRLNTEYIDLYQQHRPDPETPLEETLRSLDDLVRAGKVRYLGNSNFSGWQIADADWMARHLGLNRFVSAQNHYNLLDRRIEREVVPASARFGLGVLPYFPLASGMLTGKYRRGEDPQEGTRLAGFGARGQAMLSERNFDLIAGLTDFATERGHTLLELAMSWLASNPLIPSVIAGATRPEQVVENVNACSWSLSRDEMRALQEISARG